MKPLIRLISIFIIISLSLAACERNNDEEKLEAEISRLKQYMLEKNYSVEPTPSGLYIVEQFEGTGIKPINEDYVLINITARLVEGEKVFGTTDDMLAYENNLYNDGFLYGPFKMQVGEISPLGLKEGIRNMKEGGVSRLIFPSNLGFGTTSTGTVPAFSSLIYDVELIKVIPDPEEYDYEMVMNFLEDYEYDVLPDENGLYYIETLEGTGNHPAYNNTVEVLYTVSLLDGRLVATTSDPIMLRLNAYLYDLLDPNYTVKGLRDAILKMKVDGTATVIVPYDLAFGPYTTDASSIGYKFPLPPYSSLVYDIMLISIN